MVKNINKLYFDKNVYDSNVESGEEIKFLGKKPMKISDVSSKDTIQTPARSSRF